MMKKTKSARKALLSGVALLALTSGVCGIYALNSGSADMSAFAESQTLIEFTETDSTATGTGSSLVTNVNVDGVKVSDAWKIDLTQSYGAITFNTPIDLTGAKGIQLRMYIHWSPETLTASDNLCIHKNAITDQAWAEGSIWAFWAGVGQADRPLVQDQWVTFTITDKFPMESLSSLSIVPAAATGRQVYDDAYILVDKITAIKDGDTVNGENVVTEFGADQVSHAGQGWRSDLVSAGDDCSHGATTAWKVYPEQGKTYTVNFASPLDTTGAEGVQFRIYAHLGKVTGNVQLGINVNGTVKGYIVTPGGICIDGNEGRFLVQDQWFNFIIQGDVGQITSVGITCDILGTEKPDDGAYILVDKIEKTGTATDLDENVLTEFSYGELNSGSGGWRSDLATDFDVDGDGVADTEYGWILNPANAGVTYPVTFKNALNVSGAKGLQFRMYVHWGKITGSSCNIAFYKNGNLFANWSGDNADRPIIQDQWITFTAAENFNDSSLSSLALSFTNTGVEVYDDAFILIDSVSVIKESPALGENVITEFAADQVSHNGQGWRTDLVTETDDNNHGATTAWRATAVQGENKYLGSAVKVNLSETVTVGAGIQIRMYAHLGEITGETNIELQINGEGKGHWSSSGHFLFNTTRVIIQDEWITYTIAENDIANIQSFGFVFPTSGIDYYDDAYILVDKITKISSSPALGENVITEFAADQISHSGLGWRTDLVTDMNENNQGVTSALRIDPHYSEQSFTIAEGYDMTGVKALQFRMYLHLGEDVPYGTGTPTIGMYANGAPVNYFVNWSNESVYRKYVQDEWFTFTVTNELEKFGGTFTGLKISFDAGSVNLYDDAYILIDSITAVKETVNGEGVLTEFAADQINHKDIGWCVDAVADVDTDGDGIVDAANAYKMNYTALAGTYPSIGFVNAISLDGCGAIHLRLYVHWGTISPEGAAILIKAKNGPTEQDIVYLHSSDKLKQDEWIDVTVSAEDVAKLGGSITDIVVSKVGEGNVTAYEDAFVMLDKIYANKYTVTFVHGGELGDDQVKVAEGLTATAAAGKQEGYTVAWYADSEHTQLFDFATPVDKDITLYAVYTLNTYTVTYVHGEGIENEVVENVGYGSNVAAKESKKPGYTVKWYADEACTTEFDFANTKITSATTVYAKYTAIPYTVTYVHGGEIADEVVENVIYGSTVEAKESKKPGYTVKWYTDAACENEYLFSTPVTGNLNLYAKYTVTTYTVTFVHGGDIADEVVENVEYNSTVEAKAGKKEGYTVKWYADQAHTTEFDFANTKITEATTIYAKYTSIPYTVTYYDGSDVIATKTVDYDSTAPQDVGAKTGYTVKWYTDAACENEYSFATPVTGDLNLYAKYTVTTFTVTFVHGEGIADEVVENVEYNSTVEAKAGKKEGYTVKWYADQAHTTEFDFANTKITEATTIYAVYTANTYTVTVVLGGDSQNLEIKVTYGAKVDLSGADKEGYTVEFYTDEEMTKAFDATAPVTGNITVYAKYIQNKNSGCGGEVGVGSTLTSVALAGIAVAGALVLRKKKEDD